MGYVEQFLEILKKKSNASLPAVRQKRIAGQSSNRISKTELIRLRGVRKSVIESFQQTIQKYRDQIKNGELEDWEIQWRRQAIMHFKYEVKELKDKVGEVEQMLERMNYLGDDDAE